MHQVNVKGFFYDDRHGLTAYAAEVALSIVIKDFGTQHSVLDVGCGVGTWLQVAGVYGARIVRGIEGPWLSYLTGLVVPKAFIEIVDLEGKWKVPRRFDLSICLEVAEHLSPEAGLHLVNQLCAASPLVLFSAAVPGQGGNGHINEQWPRYWQDRFAVNGYRAIDCVRPRIWQDDRIPWWYRQNILVFATEEVARRYYLAVASDKASDDAPILGVLHPTITLSRQSLPPKTCRVSPVGLLRRIGRLFRERRDLVA